MHTKSSLRLSFALLLLLVVEALADDDNTDFLMNVFSDLGPVLALFGEQFARQFLSETFTWYDHVIFACVPLGIMTAIAGAIRVQGHKFLKAFIGRARENKAAAEIEYMSSTSAEVGELFNGRGIVRTMGQPEIAQFIVFPDELLKEKKGAQNQSYGIHTLKSASQEGILCKEGYTDELDLAAQNWLKSFKGTDTRKKDVEQAETGFSRSVSRIKRANPLQKNDRFPKYWDSLKSPNLQLNIATEKISPRRRSIELHLAAIVAVILQASLLVIAGVVPYRAEGYESQPWGLPCYIGGSVLLFIGMLACSVAIERSTKEFKWRPSSGITNETRKPSEVRDQSMDLFWVQRTQRVSDQDFDSYVISSRNKQFISTSSRREDVLSGMNDTGNRGSSQIKTDPIDDETTNKPTAKTPVDSDEDRRLESDFLAVTAIFAGGAGFTIQFIGLRGLPWPCAVAQLGAIIAMAIIRALVRRRLGDDPNYCHAPSRYELDLLATQLVEFSSPRPPNQPFKPPQKDWTWRVDTAKHRLQSIYSFRIGHCLNQSVSSLTKEDSTSSQSDQSNEAQRIMLVRKRLGDLVRWETEAFKPALALARSIERFLDEFMPVASDKNLIEWKVPMKDSKDKRCVVTLAITKKGSSGWKIKVGEVEAILSLWMAHLDATKAAKTKDKEHTDWQRSKAGVALGVDYCRILGPSDQRGVLERDIKWWVGNPAVTEITMAKKMEEGTTSSRHQTCEASYHCDDPGHDDINMVIGFMGPLQPENTHKLLVQHSTAGLATIAAQHLFTSFVWTVVDLDQLPKDFLDQGSINIHESVSIQPPKPLDLESSKLGTGRKLSHTKLTRFALHAEKEGLGVLDDILLCLIPIFSLKDVLPNDVVLKLDLPGLRGRSSWVKDAPAYLALLKFMAKDSICRFDDYLSLASVVHALDYIYLMALDDQNMAYGKALPVVDDRASAPKPDDSIKKLSVFYELQGRKDFLYLRSFQGKDWKKRDIFGWTALHYAASCKEFNLVEECQHHIMRNSHLDGCLKALMRQSHPQTWWFDNLGRSPIHVACLTGNHSFLQRLLASLSDQDARSSLETKGLDGMTPLHLSVLGGHPKCIEVITNTGHLQEFELPTDYWKRNPVHFAVAKGEYECCQKLIYNGKLKFSLYTLDIHGKSLFSYLDDENDVQRSVGQLLLKVHSKAFERKDNEGQSIWHLAIKFLDEDSIERLKDQHKSTIDNSNNNGETPLHLAVKRKDKKLVDCLLGLGAKAGANPGIKDDEGNNALHYAVGLRLQVGGATFTWREDVARKLLKSGADPQVITEKHNFTPLHFVMVNENHEILEMLLDDPRIMRGLGAAKCDGLNLLEFAFEQSHPRCLTTLLLHHHTKSTVFFMSGWERIVQKHASLVDSVELWEEWERAILNPKHKLRFPIHRLAEAGRQERIEALRHSGMNVHELDEDNWTPADVAARYRHKELEELLRKDISTRDLTTHKYCEPSTFINVYEGPELTTSPCHAERPSFSFILDVSVPPTADGMGCYLRTQEAIPPDSECFYYEIEVLHVSNQTHCVFGFCQSFVPQKSLPGWHEGSWAYHGDDGGLFVEEGWRTNRESDQTFEVGDVVGCGMNFETGKGYRTKNGVLLDSGNAFENHNFLTGKFYPCLGFGANTQGTEMRIRVALRAPEGYPFCFKGPYDGRPSEQKMQPSE
ncbi:Serine/threonine-protein phosphatase 6 regulatory ankyrin repeat subunit A [Fusarium odoratissimum]|uniref:Serine/threonine-protein phosphatase 6 regulatory ankyrin repeat subunit A n=1 Tax=Fusarium oxysporum f. sp. cubense (strain race 4) TaxID=2502994 RepID=N1S8M5_FUSC4|nr:Serine/threonine-protein phosphatase 6 regulatory ankyrin repeat subunit A [Fusarium odoratissimum]